MATITLRSVKGSALTFAEGDANFTNLNNDKLEDITSESIGDLSDVDLTGNADNYILVYNSTSGNFEVEAQPSAGIANVVDDTTPQLGGDLDGQGNTVSDVQLEDYKETVYSLGSTDSPSIDATNGNVQSVTITSGLAIPNISNFDTGATMTLIISGSGDLSDNTTGTIALFANAGTKTITTNGILSIFNDGSNYYCSLATDYTS
jgi:hypothetical protein